MNAANTETLANFRALEAAVNTAIRAIRMASQDGTFADWQAARAAAAAPCAARTAEFSRIKDAGFWDCNELEYAVQGYSSRRHTDPCIVRYADLR